MGKLFKDIDRFMNWVTKVGVKFFAWFFWTFYLFTFISGVSKLGFSKYSGASEGHMTTFLIVTSIWIWGTVRWLKRRGYINKGRRVFNNNKRFLPFILTNVVAPIVVSIIVHSITGSSSFTILSIPILSFLSANIEIG